MTNRAKIKVERVPRRPRFFCELHRDEVTATVQITYRIIDNHCTWLCAECAGELLSRLTKALAKAAA